MRPLDLALGSAPDSPVPTPDSWPLPLADPAMYAKEVHVWRASLTASPAELQRMESFLSEAERARASRLLFPERSARFVASRAIQRDILSRYTGLDPAALVIGQSAEGKPRLEHPPGCGLHFNATNSAGLALYAVAEGRRVGVDLEVVRDDRDGQSIVEHRFSPIERGYYRDLPVAERASGFHRLWTLKEAYLKAVGTGLNRSLASFDVMPGPGSRATVSSEREQPDERGEWSVLSLYPAAGHLGALAVEGTDWRLRRFQWRCLCPGTGT